MTHMLSLLWLFLLQLQTFKIDWMYKNTNNIERSQAPYLPKQFNPLFIAAVQTNRCFWKRIRLISSRNLFVITATTHVIIIIRFITKRSKHKFSSTSYHQTLENIVGKVIILNTPQKCHDETRSRVVLVFAYISLLMTGTAPKTWLGACRISEEIAKSRFEIRPGVDYKLREDIIQTRRLSWLQAPESGSKLLWHEEARDTVSLRCWDLP